MKHIENNNGMDELLKRKGSFEKNLNKIHKEELGLGVPENYFSDSKKEILANIDNKNEIKGRPFYKRKVMWLAAAGIALLFALSVFKQNSINILDGTPSIVFDTVDQIRNIDLTKEYLFTEEDHVLIASLFIDDTQIDQYVDNYILEEVVIDEYIDNIMLDEMMNDDLIFN